MTENHIPKRITGSFLAIVLIALAVLVFNAVLVLQVRDLASENKQRIADNRQRVAEIQANRVSSCKQTYEGVREVFLPLFPPIDKRTPAQVKALKTLNNTVDGLKAKCEAQTTTEGT